MSALFISTGHMSLAWMQVLMVRLPGAVILLLITALVGIEDHVHLHGLGPFSLDYIVIFFLSDM